MITIEDLTVATWVDRLKMALQILITGKVHFQDAQVILKINGKSLNDFLEGVK